MCVFTAEPVFIVRPSAARVGLNGIAKFDCVARGNPPPSVFWTKEVSEHFFDQRRKRSDRKLSWSHPTWQLPQPAGAGTINSPWSFVTAERDDMSPKWIIDFLMDRNWKSLPKNMSTDKHLQMLDVIADLDQLEFAKWNYRNEIKLANLLICNLSHCSVHWLTFWLTCIASLYPFELSLVRFMIRLCWYSTPLKRTCVQFVCLLNMRESFESHLSYSGNVINSRVLKSKLAVNKTSLHCLTQMFLLFPLELIKENINFLHNTDNTRCHHQCHFLPT